MPLILSAPLHFCSSFLGGESETESAPFAASSVAFAFRVISFVAVVVLSFQSLA